ncbi:DBH-like monooxygenase protein 1 isoform X2 [Lingula anatina]|uniref:DBH-like monooxygenase protein 1 isoform X2 n=1 Tax=Lingula anatina TaxID=7574 RepID=A0A2R2MNP6_LINAN|nr:DBH-like monooxygenase protein 1 isoform X2 [Lingula anatina]|eukprot:XP_023931836.1 DBH-like monooxygenase protein 1 isoform X2 [Lingula anatina]
MLVSTVLPLLFALAVPSLADFTHHVVLKDDVYFLSWKFDNETITFETQVRTTGYIGLGFSPNGGMTGADIVIGWVKDGTAYLKDRYATAEQVPSIDESQDVELISGSENSTFTTLRFKRRLDTCDSKDNKITQSTMRIIWAYHDSDPLTETDLLYHGNVNRGAKSMFLLEPADNPVNTVTIPNDAYTMDFINNKVQVPSTSDTTYWCSGFTLPNFSGIHHMIKAEPIVQAGNEAIVHHFIVYACNHQFNFTDHANYSESCGWWRNMPPDLKLCQQLLMAWAVGGEAQVYPENVGYPFGGEGDPTFILLETHYDNPALRNDYVDSSGVRFTFVPRRRQYDAGIMDVGVTVSRNHVIPPYYDEFYSWGQCSDCLESGLENVPEGINAFGAFLHTHLAGTSIYLRHFRDGVELPYIAYDENYDFNYQEYRYFKEPKKIMPDDDLVTHCKYKSSDRTSVTWGGLGTKQEMCLAFIMYYPRVNLTHCFSAPLQSELIKIVPGVTSASSDYGYSVIIQAPSQYAGRRFDDVMENLVNWQNVKTRDTFQALELNSTRAQFCAGINGYGHDFGLIQRLQITTQYVLPQVSCPATTTPAVTTPGVTIGSISSADSTVSVTMATVLCCLFSLLLKM